jgi:hypothetical protein
MAWVRRKVLQMDDDEIEEIDQEMAEEAAANTPTDEQGNPIPVDQNGTPMPPQPGVPPPLPGTAGGPPSPMQIQNSASLPQNPQMVSKPKTMQEEDPLLDARRKRFINDTLELA